MKVEVHPVLLAPIFLAALLQPQAPSDDAAARVAIARRCLDEGKLQEAIVELDRVLGRDPDLAEARALIASAPLALTLPAPAGRTLGTRLILFGARAKPAYRELAAFRFAALPAQEAEADLQNGFRSTSSSVRAFTAFAARRRDPGAQAGALVRRAVLDPSESVRTEAARALRDAKDETLARRVEAALEDGDARLRTNAAQSLGDMGYRSSVPALVTRLAAPAPAGGSAHPGGVRAHVYVGSQVAYVRDFDVEIAQNASIGKPIIGTVEDATVLDVRVGGTSTQSVSAEIPTVCRALGRLTGERLPETPSAWLAWWKSRAPEPPVTGPSGG
jgi:tetratricopeptide (TPR) repeat protein